MTSSSFSAISAAPGPSRTNTVRVRVPASSANLGPGFDCLGLALRLHNFVSVASAERDGVSASGEGEHMVPRGPAVEKNIAVIAVRRLCESLKLPPTPLHFHLENAVPLSRGLGSSSAARVGALVAANHWLAHHRGRSASPRQLLELADELEGHPDNVAAALLGGLTVASRIGGRTLARRFEAEQLPGFAVFVPDAHLETKTARGVLPESVPRGDAIFNVGATALLLSALRDGAWDELSLCLQDRLHQEQRAPLIPAFGAIRAALRDDERCLGVTISGAGPTVLVWLRPGADAPQVLASMRHAAQEAGVAGRALELEVDTQGCVLESAPSST
jgi:homoserine kinase